MSPNEEVIIEGGAPRKSALRVASGVVGLASIVIGIILVATSAAGSIFAVALAIYALVAGIVAVVLSFIGKDLTSLGRVGYGLVGVACIIAGIVALANLQSTKILVTFILAITLGIVWIVDGAISLWAFLKNNAPVWSVIYAALAIAAGVLLIVLPIWTVHALVVFLGCVLIILGVLRFYRAFIQTR